MTIYGVSNTGFVPKPFSVIYAEREAALKAEFGDTVDTQPGSVFGQLAAISADEEAQAWNEIAKLATNIDPLSASGIWLDKIAGYNRITRLDASSTTGNVLFYGALATTVPAGTAVQDNTRNRIYLTSGATTIEASTVHAFTLEVQTLATGDYTITIDGTDYTFTANGGSTKVDIIDGLRVALPTVDATATADGLVLRYEATNSFSLAVSANLNVTEYGVQIATVAEEAGAIPLASGAINALVTPVTGITRVINTEAGITGRNRETDEELRLRRMEATRQGIERAIQQLPGVTRTRVYINNTTTTDAIGVPRHGIWAIVAGGDNDDIATAILDRKAAGIAMRGTIAVEATSETIEQTTFVRFDRPSTVTPAISIRITKDSDYPNDGDNRIKDAVITYANSLDIGENLVYSRLFCPIQTVPGFQVDNLLIDAQQSNYPVPPDAVISLSRTDITVLET